MTANNALHLSAGLLVFLATGAHATSISVGGTALEVPAPAGFTLVTPNMTVLYEFEKHLVASTNEEFVSFIADAEAPKALNGVLPDLTRRFAVQTAKSLITPTVSVADFAQLKNILKTQNAELFQKISKSAPDILNSISKGIKDDYNVDLALSMSSMVPFPAHDETDRTLSYSMITKYNMKDAAGQDIVDIVSCTATFIHIRGKILFLYSYAEEGGIQWSRDISKQWADAVIQSNPPTMISRVAEAAPRAISGIDWSRVWEKAIGGAVIGLLFGLAAWLKYRGKES